VIQFLLAVLLIAETAFAYPQTILHGYQNCVTCHATNDGGDTLNDYGRAMSEEFMATYAREGEAREFLGLGSVDWMDLGLDYRSLGLTDVNTGKRDQFEMYTVGQLVLRHAGLSALVSYGRFGRDRVVETRQYWVNYRVDYNSHYLDFKLGYQLPVVGLGLNNHDLAIKKGNGLGRGQEKFVRQISWLNSWFELRYLLATSGFQFEQREDNFLETKYEDDPEVYLEGKFKRIEGIDFGLHTRRQAGKTTLQGFSVRAAKKKYYILMENDLNPVKQIRTRYVRTGFFPFRGLDIYFADDSAEIAQRITDIRSIGFAWMIRPRFEYEAAISQWEDQRMGTVSLKLWL